MERLEHSFPNLWDNLKFEIDWVQLDFSIDYSNLDEDCLTFNTTLNNKTLSLSIFYKDWIYKAENIIENLNQNYIKWTTTVLHKWVLELLIKLSKILNEEILYELRTKNKNILLWAKNQGKIIFKWDSYELEPNLTWHKFIKYISWFKNKKTIKVVWEQILDNIN